MALIRKRWLAGTSLAMVAVAVAALPPRTLPEGLDAGSSPVADSWHYLWNLRSPWWWPSHHTGEAIRLSTRNRLLSRLAALDRGDSILDAARRSGLRTAAGRVTVLTDGGIGPDSTATWRRLAEEELAVLPVAASQPAGVPVIVAVRTRLSTRGAREGSNADRYFLRYVIESAGEQRACIVLLEIAGVRTDWQLDLVRRRGVRGPRGAFLGACALRGRYGTPGRAGLQLERRMGVMSWRNADRLATSVEGIPGRIVATWARDFGALERDFTLRACLRGVDARCGDLVSVDQEGWWPSRPQTSLMLAAHVLQTRPAEQFHRLWRSEADFNGAVAEAYGQSAGAMVGALVRERRGAPSVGPLPRPSALLVAAAWVAGLLVISAAVSQRRQVRY